MGLALLDRRTLVWSWCQHLWKGHGQVPLADSKAAFTDEALARPPIAGAAQQREGGRSLVRFATSGCVHGRGEPDSFRRISRPPPGRTRPGGNGLGSART